MVKAGQYKGKQYGIPDDWGFDAILYRSDKVKPKAQLLGPALRRALQGEDRLVRRPRDARRSPGSTSASRTRGTRRDDAAQAVPEAAHLQEAPRPHDLVVRDQPVGGLRVRRSLDRVRLAERLGADEEEEAEGRLHAPEGEADRLGRHVHAAARERRGPTSRTRTSNAWSSARSGKWLEDNYGYGHANTLARPSSSDLLRALQLTTRGPSPSRTPTSTATSRAGAVYAKMWEQVKAPDERSLDRRVAAEAGAGRPSRRRRRRGST